jgi:hypothetical protein
MCLHPPRQWIEDLREERHVELLCERQRHPDDGLSLKDRPDRVNATMPGEDLSLAEKPPGIDQCVVFLDEPSADHSK